MSRRPVRPPRLFGVNTYVVYQEEKTKGELAAPVLFSPEPSPCSPSMTGRSLAGHRLGLGHMNFHPTVTRPTVG